MGFDFNNAEDYERFIEMNGDEKREFVEDGLANLAEVWIGDEVDDKLARSMIGAMRSLLEGAMVFQPEEANPHVAGIWIHCYQRFMRDFQTLAGITAIKRSFKDKEKGE